MANKKFNEEFKNMVVELYHSDRSLKELSSEYSVSEVMIYKWIKNILLSQRLMRKVNILAISKLKTHSIEPTFDLIERFREIKT